MRISFVDGGRAPTNDRMAIYCRYLWCGLMGSPVGPRTGQEPIFHPDTDARRSSRTLPWRRFFWVLGPLGADAARDDVRPGDSCGPDPELILRTVRETSDQSTSGWLPRTRPARFVTLGATSRQSTGRIELSGLNRVCRTRSSRWGTACRANESPMIRERLRERSQHPPQDSTTLTTGGKHPGQCYEQGTTKAGNSTGHSVRISPGIAGLPRDPAPALCSGHRRRPSPLPRQGRDRLHISNRGMVHVGVTPSRANKPSSAGVDREDGGVSWRASTSSSCAWMPPATKIESMPAAAAPRISCARLSPT